MCSTLELHKKVHSFFFGVVRLGGVWRGREGGGASMFQEVGVCMGFFRGGRGDLGSGLSQPGEKAVEQPGGAGSDAPVPSS